VYYVYEINSKIFYLSRNFVSGGVVLDLDKYLFPWQTYFIGGRDIHLRLELSCIQVNMVLTMHSTQLSGWPEIT